MKKEPGTSRFQQSVALTVSIFQDPNFLFPDVRVGLQATEGEIYMQQAFSRMAKPAVERHTP